MSDNELDQDIYLDEDELENNNNKYLPNKNKSDLDNDDNINDYIDDEGDIEDEYEDPDLNDETYENEDLDLDLDDEEEILTESNKKNIAHFLDNELENDSKIQYIIKNDDKITSNIITIYEMTELIGIRATQIANNAPVFVDVGYLTDPIEMAKKEIFENKCPLYIKRYIGLDKYELWNPNDMIKPKM